MNDKQVIIILYEALQWFVDRCNKGEIRSKRTKARYEELLTMFSDTYHNAELGEESNEQ